MFFYFFIGVIFQNYLAIDCQDIQDESAIPHQFPHHVAIYIHETNRTSPRFFCSGSIIAYEWILTTAQCVEENSPMFVYAGKNWINHHESHEQKRQVVKSIVHEDFKSPSSSNDTILKNDIALLKLETPLLYNEYVKPIALPYRIHLGTGRLYFSSWNLIGIHMLPGYAKKMESGKLKILDNDSCAREINSKISTNNLPKIEIYGSQMCTSYNAEYIRPCWFHFGSPLIKYYDGTGIQESAVLIGLYSWTKLPCEEQRLPVVYTRVSSYSDWIMEIIRKVRFEERNQPAGKFLAPRG